VPRRPVRESREQGLMHVWWVSGLLALAFLALAYGFISLAIDSGNMLEWAVGWGFLAWAALQFGRSLRLLRSR